MVRLEYFCDAHHPFIGMDLHEKRVSIVRRTTADKAFVFEVIKLNVLNSIFGEVEILSRFANNKTSGCQQ